MKQLAIGITIIVLSLLALVVSVSAQGETIEDQVLASPNDSEIIAIQWFGTDDNSIVWYDEAAALLQADLPQIDWQYAATNRVETGIRLFMFTDSDFRRDAAVWLVDGDLVLAVYCDKRLGFDCYEAHPDQPFYIPVDWHLVGDAFVLPMDVP